MRSPAKAEGPEEGFPWLLSQHPGHQKGSSLGLSALWELSAGLEQGFPPTGGFASPGTLAMSRDSFVCRAWGWGEGVAGI